MNESLAIRDEPLITGATETGLRLPDELTENQWKDIGKELGRAHRASAWWVGDWINFGAKRWGEKYEEAQRITGLSRSHLESCALVAERFQIHDRSWNLTWTHYFRAKGLPNPEEALARAAAENWSVRELLLGAKIARAPRQEPKAYYGKGDKFKESTEPLRRYLRAWESRGFDFQHVAPREARARLAVLEELGRLIQDAAEDLNRRSQTTRLSL